MNIWTRTSIAACLVVATICCCGAYAATRKAPAKKNTTTNHATVGTKQLSGENNARFGDTYTLGKSNPWNISVRSAEYSVSQLHIGESFNCPNADQKLLVLHLTVHNPQKSEALMRFDTFRFTVVDGKDTNWESINDIGSEKTQEKVDQMMKPAQKMDIYTAVLVPAASEMPKLIVKGSDELVIRYDLRQKPDSPNKVKGLAAPFADSSDATGASALTNVPAKIGDFYPMCEFDVRLDSISTSTNKVGDDELGDGEHWLVMSFTAKNKSQREALLRFDTFRPKLADQDGATMEWNGRLLSGTRDKDLDTNVPAGQEMKFRYMFKIASDALPSSLSMQQGESRVYVYGADSLK